MVQAPQRIGAGTIPRGIPLSLLVQAVCVMVLLLFMAPSRFIVRKKCSSKMAGFLFLSVILLLSIAIPPFHNRQFSFCLIENLIGIPCPGCGMTRAFLFLAHGDVRSALELNVNSLAAFLVVVVLWLQFAFNVIAGREIRVHLLPREKYFVLIVAVAATMSGWFYNLSRNPWV